MAPAKIEFRAPPKKFNLLSTTIIFLLFLQKIKIKTQQGSGCQTKSKKRIRKITRSK
jgi:hypothetical protein